MNLLLDLQSFSEAENKLVTEAELKHGRVFLNTKQLIELFWDFLESAEIDAWIFISFLTQVKKYATLSLLSALRLHNAQALMNMRQMFEAGVLASYALVEKDVTTYYYKDKHDCARENKRVKEKAYKWLENEYKNSSDVIKNQKNTINSMWTHSSILLTLLNFKMDKNEKFLSMFFDDEDDFLTKNKIWFIGNSCWGQLNLYAELIRKTKLAKLKSNFDQEMKNLGDENEKIKRELMNNPRIQKWKEVVY